jgi:hypothetical protein
MIKVDTKQTMKKRAITMNLIYKHGHIQMKIKTKRIIIKSIKIKREKININEKSCRPWQLELKSLRPK